MRRFSLLPVSLFQPSLPCAHRQPYWHRLLLGNTLSGVGAAVWVVFIIFFSQLFGKGAIQQATALIMGANAFGQLLGFIFSALFYNLLGMRFLCWLSVGASVLATIIAISFRQSSTEDASLACDVQTRHLSNQQKN